MDWETVKVRDLCVGDVCKIGQGHRRWIVELITPSYSNTQYLHIKRKYIESGSLYSVHLPPSQAVWRETKKKPPTINYVVEYGDQLEIESKSTTDFPGATRVWELGRELQQTTTWV